MTRRLQAGVLAFAILLGGGLTAVADAAPAEAITCRTIYAPPTKPAWLCAVQGAFDPRGSTDPACVRKPIKRLCG